MKKFLKDRYVKKVTKHIEEVSHEEDLDETFDEDEVLIFTLPLDEDIQASVPPAHQEENMMSYTLLKNLMMLYSMTLEVKKY
jgi:hypothetical protein